MRVEYEHIKLLKNFDPIHGFKLPYPVKLDADNDEEGKSFVSNLVSSTIKKRERNFDTLIRTDDKNIRPQIEAYRLQFFDANECTTEDYFSDKNLKSKVHIWSLMEVDIYVSSFKNVEVEMRS